jgi:hypothetical protein
MTIIKEKGVGVRFLVHNILGVLEFQDEAKDK